MHFGYRESDIAMWKEYDLESDETLINASDDKKFNVKGLDTVRSSFPKSFREFTKRVLISILKQAPKNTIDKMIVDFKASMSSMPFNEIARNTAVNKIEDFDHKKDKGFRNFPPVPLATSSCYCL